MSTVTTTLSVAETLFETFVPCERKYDLRTARGKFAKSLENNQYISIATGTADLLETRYVYNDDDSQTKASVPVKYNVIHTYVNEEWNNIFDYAELYLREVAPTRKVFGSNYKDVFNIPNVVRIAVESIYVEDRVDESAGRDRYEAFKVFSIAIDPETDKAFYVFDVVGHKHQWDSNPFIKEGEWRREDDDISTLTTFQGIKHAVEERREQVKRHTQQQRLETECIEAGLASVGSSYANFKHNCELFLLEFGNEVSPTLNQPITNAFENAYNVALQSVVEFYLSVLGKTSWQVSSRTFDLGRRGYWRSQEERDAERPRFIDEVLAYAITADWFISQDNYRTTPEGARGEVLSRFNEVLRGVYRINR